MSDARGWILRNVACEACGGHHDLFFEAEPVIHRDIIFTCPITEAGSRVREPHDPEPVEELTEEVVFAHAT
jgi:hypothetical protein